MKNCPVALNRKFRGIRRRTFAVQLTVVVFLASLTTTSSGGKTWFEQRTGINPSKPIPRISRSEINDEVKKKLGIDPRTPLAKAGNNWLFKGWKPFREPLLPAERAATEGMAIASGIEKYTVLFLESMVWNRHWPEGFPKQIAKPLAEPSIEIALQKKTINAAAALYKGESIPIAGSDHVEVGDVTLSLDVSRNVYIVNMSGGKIVYKFLRENSFHIKSATFEAVPAIGPIKGNTILAVAARCVYLDVEDCPGEIDRFIARAVTDALEHRNGGIVASVEIGSLLAQPLDLHTESKQVGVLQVKDAAVFVRGEAVVAQLACDLLKRPKLLPKTAAPAIAVVPAPPLRP